MDMLARHTFGSSHITECNNTIIEEAGKVDEIRDDDVVRVRHNEAQDHDNGSQLHHIFAI
eukprot:58561-Ditylum_brightwellii.AAC.1